MAAAIELQPSSRKASRRLVIGASLLAVALIAAMLITAASEFIGARRLPDSAEILSTTWSSTPWVKNTGKADVTLRLSRRDHHPISSTYVVVAYGGKVYDNGPNGDFFLASAQSEYVKPATVSNTREMIVELRIIPTTPGQGGCEIVIYNDAPAWKADPSRRTRAFLLQRFPHLAGQVWRVDLPRPPAPASVSRRE